MKRYGNLWHQIIDWQNLLVAARKAQAGKRFRPNVLAFNYHLEAELFQLQRELERKTYQPGTYRTFRILDPKPRLISAAPYRDRVVHHALCKVIAPLLERTFIDNTYANREGLGTHRALKKFTKFARSSRYVLQCDISKYFPSIDHEILKQIVRRKLKCLDTLWLIDLIIDNSNLQEEVGDRFPEDDLLAPITRRKGLPIGNLTSQFFANLYLSQFDHFVKEQLKARKYVRYVDDFSLFSDDKIFLEESRSAIESYLVKLRLKLHPVKTQLLETKYGVNFVGFRVLGDRIRVRTDNLRRARGRLKKLKQRYESGLISDQELNQRLQSWLSHLDHADSYRLKQKIFQQQGFSNLIIKNH